MMALQLIAEFFLMPETRGAAQERRSGTGMNARASSHVRAKILAPQYVMPRTEVRRAGRLKTKKIFNR
jgi:hypothetical protein